MARAGAWVALGVQPVWTACWLLAGALEGGYSPTHQYVSELGWTGDASAWLVNGGLVLWGVSMVAAGVALRAVGSRRAVVPAALLMVAGIAIALAGPLHVDCYVTIHKNCGHSFSHHAHMWLSLVAETGLTLSGPAVAWALWPSLVARLLLPGAALGVGLYAWGWIAGTSDSSIQGVAQRIGILTAEGWLMLIGVGALLALDRVFIQPKRARYAATQSVAIRR